MIDKSAMEQAISRARRAHESGRGFDPEWVYLPEAEMHGLIGSSYMFAGLHAKAGFHLQAAADASAEWAREQLGWQVYQAHNYIEAGDPAQACALLNANYQVIGSVGSARLQRKLDAITAAVRPHAATLEVREFLELTGSYEVGCLHGDFGFSRNDAESDPGKADHGQQPVQLPGHDAVSANGRA